MMGTDVYSGIDHNGEDGIGVEAFDLLGVRAESEKEKAKCKKKDFCH